jgi:amino acid adenylation domain-containing protein
MVTSNLVELLCERSLRQPERRIYTYLTDGEVDGASLTYAELDRSARSIGAQLQHSLAVGERALLLYPPGLEFISAFFACLYAGIVAIPAHPPRPGRRLEILETILKDSQATLILTTLSIRSKLEPESTTYPWLKGLRWMATDEPNTAPADRFGEWRAPEISNETLALLQYTSGSTAVPKGVMVTHGNLLHNENMIKQAFQVTEESVIVGWLPLYHDMGLIGNVLQPLYAGAQCILMSPLAFLQKPVRWLQAITRYRATVSGGPNFAYDLCVRKVTPEQRATLQLDHWEVAFNGAEPVRYDTLQSFSETFAPNGFRREAFYPCYGLAEATLFVCGAERGSGARANLFDEAALGEHRVIMSSGDEARTLISCGRPSPGQTVVIADPESLAECPPDRIGEVWVSTLSVASGYWNRPEETKEVFRTHLAMMNEGSFLRTGDLGFLNQGQLYITGRLKDLIIVRGRNYYPQDIELTVERSHPSLRFRSGAAFSIEVNGEERLVVAQETTDHLTQDLDAIINAIRQAITEDHELAPFSVILLKPGAIPKTSSGKTQRHLCRNAFLTGTFPKIREWREGPISEGPVPSISKAHPKNIEETESWLREVLAEKLRMDRHEIDPQQPILQYGVDSMMTMEVAHAIEMGLGVTLPISSLLNGLSLTKLAVEVFSRLGAAPIKSAASPQTTLDGFPLTHGQRSLFFLHQFVPESPVYNIIRAVSVHGDLDVSALHRAFQSLVDRHAALRTTFDLVHGEPVQRVHPDGKVHFQVHDFSLESEAALKTRLEMETLHRFDLNEGPLFSIKLFVRSSQESVLLLNLHHIIADLWSLAIIVHDLNLIYRAEKSKMAAELTSLPHQYADYVNWQSDLMAGSEGNRLWTFWQKQMAGGWARIDLPTDRLRPQVQTYRGSCESIKLGQFLAQELKAFSQAHGVTLFTTLLATFQALLHRYTGQEEILVGSPVTGRSRADWAGIVGYFVNSVALRVDISGNETFLEFLGGVRHTILQAFEHSEYPFGLLTERMRQGRDPGRSSTFQVMLVLQQTPWPGDEGLASLAAGQPGAQLQLGDLVLESIDLKQPFIQCDLVLTLADGKTGLFASLQYNTDLFESATIVRMLGHYRTMLASIVANPGQRVSDLPLLTGAEREQLLKDIPGQTDAPTDMCLHRWFEDQVERTPAAIAVTYEGDWLSYRELNRRANQLAHRLRTLGVRPEVIAAISMERSLEMIVSILGILKAGGAYVPLDPSSPKERLAFILEETHAPILVTQSTLLDSLPVTEARMIAIDSDWEEIAAENDQNPVANVSHENLAYVIYTSGSTGRPKGVSVTHRNVVRLFAATQPLFSFGKDDIWTLFHSYAFDFSVWELWGALFYGGRLVVVPYWVSRSPEDFHHLLHRERVTVLNQTPSAFRQLMQVEETADEIAQQTLRYVIFGGEALELQSLRPWFEKHRDGSNRLINMYGITETTVHATYRSIATADLSELPGSVIGAAIPDLELQILDRRLQLLPVGIQGEIAIAGAGLARGYLRRPDLTADRFIPNPYGQTSGARLYRSGDVGRRKSDGDTEYLGRLDTQVKVRGFRIELGEIQSVLSQHPAVRQTVVLFQDHAQKRLPVYRHRIDGGRPTVLLRHSRHYLKEQSSESQSLSSGGRIVAYMVCDPSHPYSVTSLRSFLLQTLPDYMVPSFFVFMESLPVTANGKLDRSALPLPDRERPELSNSFVPPRNQVEKELAGIWSQALDLAQVGIDDNYFALGGDSIRSLKVLAMAEGKGLRFSLQEIFRFQTIRELAEVAGVMHPEEGSQIGSEPFNLILSRDHERLLQEVPQDLEDAYPLARMQAGLIFHSDQHPQSSVYRATFLYRLRGDLECDRFRAAVQQVIDRHAILRTSFDLTGYREPLQLVHRRVAAPLQFEDLRHHSVSDQERALDDWFESERRRDFDLSCPPLIRFTIHRLADGIFTLGITCHDTILDGWSTSLILTELLQRYCALRDGNALPVEPPVISYRDFVALERRTLESEECLNYWSRKLDGCSVIKIPQASSPKQSGPPRLSVADVEIPLEVSNSLKELAQMAGVSLKHVLLAAHLRVLSFLGGEADVLTGFEANGRPEEADGDQAVGQHLNTIPFRQKLSGGTWIDLVRETFETERELLPFRRLPYAEIQKRYGGQPLYDTTFNYTHFHVFQNLHDLKGLEIIDGRGRELTHYTLKTEFNRDAFSDRIYLDLICDVTKLDSSQMEAIGGYYSRVLIAMAQEPFARYESYSLLSPKESHRILQEWNATTVDYPWNGGLDGLVETQVERTPQSIAANFGDAHLTFEELNRRSNQLARYLQSLGIGPEMPVGVCMERSLELVVALLGILKAGAAYLPLDPDYPEERLLFMLKDSQAQLLITQERLLTIFTDGGPDFTVQKISLDSTWKSITCEDAENLKIPVDPMSPAYLIYTSGSTGVPKGVVNTHGGISNRLLWMQKSYQLTSDDRVLQKTPFSFDVSLWEFFWPLLTGASLVLARPGGHQECDYLVRLITEQQITTIHFVPTMLQVLLEEPGLEWCGSLKRLFCSGEVLPFDLQTRFFSRLRAELHNLYGPTEAAVDVTFWACPPTNPWPIVPIGRPIANTQVHILDRHLQPVPVGTAGELHIGGAGLARGYWRAPERTAENFIPNPFSQRPGARLYRTGDLSRYLSDGCIEFLGRIDHQVKVRGIRIELGEIEAALNRHPEVEESVVIARETDAGQIKLVAYLVARTDREFSHCELRDFLQQRLPKYMVPADFVSLENFPLTPSGKIDRRRLPAPNLDQIEIEEMAELLAQIEQLSEDEVKAILSGNRIEI